MTVVGIWFGTVMVMLATGGLPENRGWKPVFFSDDPPGQGKNYVLDCLSMALGGPAAVGVLCTLLVFWHTMLHASVLARDAVKEVIHQTLACDPTDEDSWKESVEQPALALAATMQHLSHGWGRGLLGVTLFCWFQAFGGFCNVSAYSFFLPASVCAADASDDHPS